ncbi:hypothetical protein H9L12_08030 [Sphingomonas rhizophila]|uniref:DUF4956 domain-containing protein n=1 Tax=Sphingomonas rhizophila TaxID=2071607 RepID=A0A7G9S8X1_9SPHN|nr:hypothetical protein [Sphingomonas rhizophila]QNN64296.1 hypothetical protein H9L12_08030 [Sphingomonas rhizophila]
MDALKLLTKLITYYVVIVGLALLALRVFPSIHDYMPVGGVKAILTQSEKGVLAGNQTQPVEVKNIGESLIWLAVAIGGALLTSIPVSWVYMGVRSGDEYDQSLISTILILPLVVTSIVVVVQNSLSLAFALGGIAGAVRFKNSLKSSGDALFILLSVGIGLASGIGAVELAMVMSVAFNLCFVLLWWSEYGEREGMKRYLSDFRPDPNAPASPPAGTAVPPATPPSPPAV